MDKYLKGVGVFEWIQKGCFTGTNVSIVWKGTLEVIPLITPNLIWRVGDGSTIRIGIDCFVRGEGAFKLSDSLLQILHGKGYHTLDHITYISGQQESSLIGASYLRLEGSHILEWMRYLSVLDRMGITLSLKADSLMWSINYASRDIVVKLAYDHISKPPVLQARWWGSGIWGYHALLKIICFMWLVLHDRIITWNNLLKRG